MFALHQRLRAPFPAEKIQRKAEFFRNNGKWDPQSLMHEAQNHKILREPVFRRKTAFPLSVFLVREFHIRAFLKNTEREKVMKNHTVGFSSQIDFRPQLVENR